MTLFQGLRIRPRETFQFKMNGKGRTITFKATNAFWVSTVPKADGSPIEVSRHGYPMGFGYRFTPEQIQSLFISAEGS